MLAPNQRHYMLFDGFVLSGSYLIEAEASKGCRNLAPSLVVRESKQAITLSAGDRNEGDTLLLIIWQLFFCGSRLEHRELLGRVASRSTMDDHHQRLSLLALYCMDRLRANVRGRW